MSIGMENDVVQMHKSVVNNQKHPTGKFWVLGKIGIVIYTTVTFCFFISDSLAERDYQSEG